MKKPQAICAGVVFVLAVSLHLLPAQEAAPVAGGTDSTVDWSSASDLEVELQAVESLPTIPATAAPQAGTFYSAQHAPGSAEPWPPMPANIRDVPLWSLGDNIFLLSDLTVNYDQPIKTKTTAKSGGMMTMDDVDLNPGDGDTNDDGGGYTNNVQFTPINTNGLWLQITNVSGGVAYLNLMNATDSVYEVMSKENLLATDWDIIGELFPTNATTNVMPFTVAANSPTNLFVWAMDWAGVTSGGNTTPEWWFWKYFGTTDLSDTNLDSTGDNTLLYDYQNGVDPNVIEFSLQFTNNDFNATPVYGGITIQGGEPGYEAILINDTNLADADWEPCTSTNVMVSLNWGDGLYNVMVGLKGLPADATPTWVGTQLTLNTVAPAFTVTNPASGSVSAPMIQLQGIVSESLSSLTFDVSNAVGVVTNQTGYWQPVFYDTNLLNFTTNTFQCYDIPLTNGVNVITLHATDLAGNTTTTNFSYTLSYAGVTNAPVLSLIWPTNNTLIGGSNVTIQAQVSDATATVTATVGSNTVQGLIERSGLVWLQNVPLNSGTNVVTITSQNAAGKVSTNILDIVQSSVNLTIDPISSDQLNQTSVTVTGTVSDPDADVWVNGMEVNWNDDNDWYADNVPVSASGTVILTAEAGADTNDIEALQTLDQAQPATVELMSYASRYYDEATANNDCSEVAVTSSEAKETVNWLYSSGGVDSGSYNGQNGDCQPEDYSYDNSLEGGDNGYSPTWECNDVTESSYVSYPGEGIGGSVYSVADSQETDTKTHVMIEPSGQQAIGQTALYLVMAQVMDEDTGLQLAADGVRFVNQLAGTAAEDVTNDDGSVWTEAVVSGAAGAQTEVTPSASGFPNINFTGMKLSKLVYISVDSNNKPSTFDAQTVQTTFQSELFSNVFYSLPTGEGVRIMVRVNSSYGGILGWNSSKQTYVNRVMWGEAIGGGPAYSLNGKTTIDPIVSKNHNGGSDPGTQFWVNVLAHEVIWLNACGFNDHDISPPAGEISSGLWPPLTAEFTVWPANQGYIISAFGF